MSLTSSWALSDISLASKIITLALTTLCSVNAMGSKSHVTAHAWYIYCPMLGLHTVRSKQQVLHSLHLHKMPICFLRIHACIHYVLDVYSACIHSSRYSVRCCDLIRVYLKVYLMCILGVLVVRGRYDLIHVKYKYTLNTVHENTVLESKSPHFGEQPPRR